MRVKITAFVLAACTIFIASGCRKNQKRIPIVTTSATSVGAINAQCAGVLYSEGDAKVTEKGICWAKHAGVSVEDNKVICNTEEKSFSAGITGLDGERTYYARAYAINQYGVAYGKVTSFTTLSSELPVLTLSITSQPFDYGADISVRVQQSKKASYTVGVCWSMDPNPDIANSTSTITSRDYTAAVPINANFGKRILGLGESGTYYLTAYATNSTGTVYSNQLTYTTPNPVSISSIYAIGFTSVACNAKATTGRQIVTTGVCWSQLPFPTTADNKKEAPYIFANFNYDLDPLDINTSYYVRAYIVDSDGRIIYSPQRTTRTLKGTVTDLEGNVYTTVQIGSREWMTSNLKTSYMKNGTLMQQVTNSTQWQSAMTASNAVYCYYSFNSSYNSSYGKLYPLHVAQNSNLPPAGWRVSTVSDWQNLLASATVPDLYASDNSWTGTTSQSLDSYGFSLRPGGQWSGSSHYGINNSAYFWAFPVSGTVNNIYFQSATAPAYLSNPAFSKPGYSVRCVKE